MELSAQIGLVVQAVSLVALEAETAITIRTAKGNLFVGQITATKSVESVTGVLLRIVALLKVNLIE